MLDAERAVILAANALSVLLESAAGPRGLKHPRHVKVVSVARAKVEKVMRDYFARQEAALLAEIKPKIAAAVSMHTEALREADGGNWRCARPTKASG